MIFSHHGDHGDVVYSLMAAKFLCDEAGGRCVYYLCPARDTRLLMTAEHAEGILPLVREQPYVERAEWRELPLGLRLDVGQRRFWKAGLNLADQHAHYLALPYSGGGGPWLTVREPNPLSPVVFARSQRYRNPRFPWPEAYRRWADRAVFVGTPAEHADFEGTIGRLPIVPTATLLDVARVIAGCKLFVGNQSCPRAIAEGLKVPVAVEMGTAQPHTHFERPDAWYDRLPPADFVPPGGVTGGSHASIRA